MDDIELMKILGEIQKDIGEMKVDLKHHIKRSDTNEKKLEVHDKHIMKIVIALAVSAGALGLKLAPLLVKLI